MVCNNSPLLSPALCVGQESWKGLEGQVGPKVSCSCSQNLAGAATAGAGLPSCLHGGSGTGRTPSQPGGVPQGSHGEAMAFVRSGLRTHRHSFQHPILAEAVTEVPRFNERGQRSPFKGGVSKSHYKERLNGIHYGSDLWKIVCHSPPFGPTVHSPPASCGIQSPLPQAAAQQVEGRG